MSSELVPSPPDHSGSALSDFLRHSVVHEKAGSIIPLDLLSFGLLGSGVVILTGLLALAFPSPHAVAQGQFFLLLASEAAGLDSLMKHLAIAAICSGFLLLGIDLILMQVRTSEHWRLAVVGQAAVGGVGGMLCTLLLAIAILNFVLWIVIIVCCIALFLFVIGAMLSGG
jgi:hypothetical protein